MKTHHCYQPPWNLQKNVLFITIHANYVVYCPQPHFLTSLPSTIYFSFSSLPLCLCELWPSCNSYDLLINPLSFLVTLSPTMNENLLYFSFFNDHVAYTCKMTTPSLITSIKATHNNDVQTICPIKEMWLCRVKRDRLREKDWKRRIDE